MSENNVFNLQDVLKIGIQIGVETALEQMHKQRMENIKCRYDRRLRNTRLLLENYKVFMMYCNKAVYTNSRIRPIDILEDIDSILDDNDELVIDSIKRSKERTYIIVNHINEMAKMYKVFTEQSEKPEEIRKYKIIVNLYLSKCSHTKENIATKLHIDVRTLNRDLCLAIEQLSRFIFGVDGVKMHKFMS